MPKTNVLGITIDDPSLPEILRFVDEQVANNNQSHITTINSELLQLSLTNTDFKKAVIESSLRLCDGVGVQWAATFTRRRRTTLVNLIILPFSLLKLLFQPSSGRRIIKHRTTGRLLFEDLLTHAAQKRYSIFLLGGGEEVAQRVAVKIRSKYPGLTISGAAAGDPEDPARVLADIKPSNILFVAYGSPKQEIFIHQQLQRLSSNVAIGIGGTFDNYVGAKPIGSAFRQIRPPQWVHRWGLESFWRLATQPNRFKRVGKATLGLAVKVATFKQQD